MSPAWSPRGVEIFYVRREEQRAGADATEHMMVVDVDVSGADIRLGDPRELFSFKSSEWIWGSYPNRSYDVSPDGRAFLAFRVLAQAPSASSVTRIQVALNWVEELKVKVPIK